MELKGNPWNSKSFRSSALPGRDGNGSSCFSLFPKFFLNFFFGGKMKTKLLDLPPHVENPRSLLPGLQTFQEENLGWEGISLSHGIIPFFPGNFGAAEFAFISLKKQILVEFSGIKPKLWRDSCAKKTLEFQIFPLYFDK